MVETQISKSEDGPTTATASYRPQVAKAVLSATKKLLPSMLCRVAVPVEHETLRDEIFNPQGWAIAETHTQLSVLPYGCTEVRVLLSGSYMVAGVKMASFGEKDLSLSARLEKLQSENGMKSFLSQVPST